MRVPEGRGKVCSRKGVRGITAGKFSEFEMLSGTLTAFFSAQQSADFNSKAPDILTMGLSLPRLLTAFYARQHCW